MTGSGNNGVLQSVEPAVDANYVLAFVGDTRRTGDEECGSVNKLENYSESSTTDEKVDGERAITQINASPSSR